ncbi:GDSL-type esterase/lipase family protein [Sinomicrobium weinanense]|uniref:SGNH hydrolase-type esterase domain-containing protein n=1 Tax=Sinomicrobium weinanense TaxID=2842200 RepID=A0A926JV97_9FLAO|nr:GDSL-type esterase/lipase family protein [Sinomicrobium weinanense]MBC9798225.1 hypothetical protein [Sinomicrobium weinanense]MBU3125317.1 G-D-S-L family lipolytic protein [Sinomicrobium weinanense]
MKYLLLILLISIPSGTYAQRPDNPLVFQKQINRFKQQDARSMPDPGVIVFTGSSSVGGWKQLDSCFPDHRVINRGFGGSRLFDALYYFDDIIAKYKPDQVVLYSGENDIASGKSPGKVKRLFKKFHRRFKKELPGARLIFVSIKPSITRWRKYPDMAEANRRIERFIRRKQNVAYVDVATHMLNERGKPLPYIFKKDKLHMNPRGYTIWQEQIGPLLVTNKESTP